MRSRLSELSQELCKRGRGDLLGTRSVMPCEAFDATSKGDAAAEDRGDQAPGGGDLLPIEARRATGSRRNCLIAEYATDMIWAIEFGGDEVISKLLRHGEPREVAEHLLGETRFTYVSPASQSLLGFAPADMQLMQYKRILTSESYAYAKNVLAEEVAVERRGGADPARQRTVEMRHTCSTGAIRWCEVKARFLRDEENGITGLFGATRDISSRKTAEHSAEKALAHMRRLHDTINRSPAIVYRCRIAEGWPVDFVSEGVHKFGYLPKDFLSGRVSWPSLTHPDDVDRVKAEIKRHREKDVREFTLEYRLLTKEGEVRWVEDRILVVSEMDGDARYIQGILLDVTQRHQAKDALRESSATLLQLFSNLPDFVLVVDRNARIQFVNRGAPGVPADELIGTAGFGHILPEYQSNCREALQRAFASGEARQVEARTVYDMWWDCRVVPIPGGEQSESAMIICSDITQQRSAERSVRIQLRLSARLSETSDLVEALEACLDAVLEISEADCGGIYIARESGDFELFVHRGMSERMSEAVRYYEAATPQAQLVVKGVPVYTDVADMPESLCGHVDDDLRSFAFVPVLHEGRAIACVNLSSRSVSEVAVGVRGGLETTTALVGSAIARIQADRSRQEIDARMRNLVENMPDVVLITDLEGRIQYVNWTHPVTSTAELLGTTGLQCFPTDQHKLILAAYEQAVQSREVQSYECHDKYGRWWSCRAVPMIENGTVHGLMVINTDITESKHFERELSETVTRQQQGMGRQLHDDLGQQLVGARLIAEGLQQELEARSLPESTRTGELVAALGDAENRVRELIKGVRPVEVDANGLMAALDDLAGSTGRLSNIRCSFTCDEPVPVENSHTATQLFYIASEAVQNSVKHAIAEQITIGLDTCDDHLRLWVADDGIGMPARAGGAAGMGLRIMRHRASVIGAELRFDGPHQGGTRVTCILLWEPSK